MSNQFFADLEEAFRPETEANARIVTAARAFVQALRTDDGYHLSERSWDAAKAIEAAIREVDAIREDRRKRNQAKPPATLWTCYLCGYTMNRDNEMFLDTECRVCGRKRSTEPHATETG